MQQCGKKHLCCKSYPWCLIWLQTSVALQLGNRHHNNPQCCKQPQLPVYLHLVWCHPRQPIVTQNDKIERRDSGLFFTAHEYVMRSWHNWRDVPTDTASRRTNGAYKDITSATRSLICLLAMKRNAHLLSERRTTKIFNILCTVVGQHNVILWFVTKCQLLRLTECNCLTGTLSSS